MSPSQSPYCDFPESPHARRGKAPPPNKLLGQTRRAELLGGLLQQAPTSRVSSIRGLICFLPKPHSPFHNAGAPAPLAACGASPFVRAPTYTSRTCPSRAFTRTATLQPDIVPSFPWRSRRGARRFYVYWRSRHRAPVHPAEHLDRYDAQRQPHKRAAGDTHAPLLLRKYAHATRRPLSPRPQSCITCFASQRPPRERAWVRPGAARRLGGTPRRGRWGRVGRLVVRGEQRREAVEGRGEVLEVHPTERPTRCPLLRPVSQPVPEPDPHAVLHRGTNPSSTAPIASGLPPSRSWQRKAEAEVLALRGGNASTSWWGGGGRRRARELGRREFGVDVGSAFSSNLAEKHKPIYADRTRYGWWDAAKSSRLRTPMCIAGMVAVRREKRMILGARRVSYIFGDLKNVRSQIRCNKRDNDSVDLWGPQSAPPTLRLFAKDATETGLLEKRRNRPSGGGGGGCVQRSLAGGISPRPKTWMLALARVEARRWSDELRKFSCSQHESDVSARLPNRARRLRTGQRPVGSCTDASKGVKVQTPDRIRCRLLLLTVVTVSGKDMACDPAQHFGPCLRRQHLLAVAVFLWGQLAQLWHFSTWTYSSTGCAKITRIPIRLASWHANDKSTVPVAVEAEAALQN
ncbi:hypothetical protein K438DRAFT_1777298 [Mycena galopus ATCC 62051]|nr:hypothetical protein K438DRAFT_1777298 [Mycena galopus ATCC 62051]